MKLYVDTDMEELEWADAKDEIVLAFETLGDELQVELSNVGWTKAYWRGVVESHEAWKLLSINGDYRLVAEVDEDSIMVVRYSHDEPMGATHKFTKAKETANV